MSLLSHIELVRLVESGVINAKRSQVNGASIDITLDNVIRIESEGTFPVEVDLFAKESIFTEALTIPEHGYRLHPREFILASSREVFNLPNDIVAEYVLKSSQARNGMNHLLAGYADPGWSNSKLTLELHNVTRYHTLILKPGMPIGQVKFYRVTPVPESANYSVTGQYNNQQSVQESKGIR